MRRLIALLPFLAIATPVLADETTGEIVAFDRVARIIVLTDNTVWQFGEATELSADLVAGDEVRIVFTSAGDSGVGSISSVTRVEG
ncbi:MAG: hypothetical protein OEM24_10150 [Paracoccaceae bacterium]|nr:hypothetical protein [Paracoccaceae bacterium]